MQLLYVPHNSRKIILRQCRKAVWNKRRMPIYNSRMLREKNINAQKTKHSIISKPKELYSSEYCLKILNIKVDTSSLWVKTLSFANIINLALNEHSVEGKVNRNVWQRRLLIHLVFIKTQGANSLHSPIPSADKKLFIVEFCSDQTFTDLWNSFVKKSRPLRSNNDIPSEDRNKKGNCIQGQCHQLIVGVTNAQQYLHKI